MITKRISQKIEKAKKNIFSKSVLDTSEKNLSYVKKESESDNAKNFIALKKARKKMITLSMKEIKMFAEKISTNYKKLVEISKANKKAKEILLAYNKKVSERKNLSFVAQTSSRLVDNKNFVITNTKSTSTKNYLDALAISKDTILELRKITNFDLLRNLCRFISKFVLCNFSSKAVESKHERFYSQCIAEINYILDKNFIEEITACRSKDLKIKQITLDNIEKKKVDFLKLLLITSKAKSKTAKLVKSKSQKKAVKKAVNK